MIAWLFNFLIGYVVLMLLYGSMMNEAKKEAEEAARKEAEENKRFII